MALAALITSVRADSTSAPTASIPLQRCRSFTLDIALLLRIPTSGHVSSTNAPESMLRAKIRSREVGCLEPTTHSHLDQGALLRRQHELVPGCGTWRVTEPVAKLACEMGIVAKAAGVGNLAQGLVSTQ